MASFPTLASAMTGYVVRPDAFKDYPNDDGNFVSFSEFDIVAYVVHDAWRINESDRALVGYSPVIGARSLRVPLMRKASGTILSNICNKWDLGSAHGCDFANSISRYVTEYGLYGLNQTPSVWRMFGAGPIQLPPPVLNVTAFYLTRLLGHDWVHPETGQRPFQDPSGVMYMHEKLQTTYSLDYLDQYGRCQPSADVYRWGFSYFQVFIMAIVLLVWTAGAWMVWLKAHINLPLDGPQYCGEAPRGWKCLLPLASTMQTQLAAADIDPTVLTEDDLRSKISRRVKRGAVSFERGTPSPTTRKPEVPLSRFLCRMAKERKWRVAIFCVYLGVACLVFVEYVALWPTPRGWVVFVVTWLASLGAYGFLFCAHMAWLLWLYLPCSSAVVVAVCLDVFGVIGDNKGLYNIWPGGN
ncbi:hypothetical protein N658DRAFT_414314 [Parathielavia hyrcaniae]|uniref:Uncharacterized protein n=1 Tax=Parathielavia hyrcaniae TaxID=113614 RepID=A0AAN6QBL3_9PEZI|nr:hypothetical protein N658DRAFT_414314 [Parathielavia hyrcaniae]